VEENDLSEGVEETSYANKMSVGLEHALYNAAPPLSYPSPKREKPKINLYETIIKKAYNLNQMNSSVLLDQAKESLNANEFKLIKAMLNMRGTYSVSQGKPMLSKQIQTEPLKLSNATPQKMVSERAC